MEYTRRELGRLMLGSLPLATLMPRNVFAGQATKRPNSTFAGVAVGMTVPSNFGTRTMPVDEVILKTPQLTVGAAELRSQPIELFMGVPRTVLEPGRDKAAQKQATEDLRAWRLKANPADA